MTIQFPGKASDFLKIGVAAAARGDIEAVREVLKARPAWISHIGSHGRTMLWEASHRGRLEMVKYLVRRKADINACGTHYTPYFVEVSCYCIARHKKHDDVADFLLTKGATIDIHTAAFLGDLDSVKQFLKKKRKLLNEGHPHYVMGREVNQPDIDFVIAPAPWATPLCYALRGGDMETVEYLIKRGATIQSNEEALFIAAKENVERIRLLLENGADPKLYPYAVPNDSELYRVVSSFGVKAASTTELGEELVYLCRGDRGGNPREVTRLLDLGADVNFQDHKGKTALHRAAKAGFIETMTILLKRKASVEVEDLTGETPLFDAVRSTIRNADNKKKAIRMLLKAKANRQHTNRKDQTPLDVAKNSRQSDGKSIATLLRRSR